MLEFYDVQLKLYYMMILKPMQIIIIHEITAHFQNI